MAIEVNGVSLPDIPEETLASYPYAVIVKDKGGALPDNSYMLLCAHTDFIHGSPDVEIMGTPMFSNNCLVTMSEGISMRLYIPDVNTAWPEETVEESYEVNLDDDATLVWANHDVLTLSGLDDNYNPVYGEVYFADSTTVYAEEYIVKSEWLIAMSQQVRRLCSGKKRTTDKMLEDLTAYKGTASAWLSTATEALDTENDVLSITSDTENVYAPSWLLIEISGYPRTTVDFPNAKQVSSYFFEGWTKLANVNMPLLETIGSQAFAECTSLKKLDFQNLQTIDFGAFSRSGLETLIIRTSGVCVIDTDTVDDYPHPFVGTPIYPGDGETEATGYIYVPSSLVSSYKSAALWSMLADRIRALEDYTVDGTTTGALDETKI